EQVRDNMVAAMPALLGELHYALHHEVAWLHVKWTDFRGLFARSPETIELLNAAAPAFFQELQRMMWEDVLLHLFRLTDPPQSVGHDNLTLQRLPKLISDQNLLSQVKPLVDRAVQRTKFARDWRNRRLAHKELPPPAGQPAQALAPASRQDVEGAL